MKKITNKYSGYTLLEVIMVMLIIGIVIYMSYSIVIFLNSYAYNSKRDFEELSEVIFFSGAFKNDLYSAKKIEVHKNELKLYANDTTIYNFYSSKISRESEQQFSLMGLKEVQFNYNQRKSGNKVFWNFLVTCQTSKKGQLKLKFYRTTIITDSLIQGYETK